MTLPLGWHTDLAALRDGGSQIEDRGDHLVVRTPANPFFHWGNFVLVTDAAASDRAEHWLGVFEAEFPDAAHRSVGLVAEPREPARWKEVGLGIEHEDVLATDTCPVPTAVPEGYVVRRVESAEDWVASTELNVAAYPDDAEFERRAVAGRAEKVARGKLAWFGAFAEGVLVSELGIFDAGEGIARYQAVLTAAEHRRRGLTGHLLGVAAAEAAGHGASTWVIIADGGSDASRLYQARGFRPADRGIRAYRKPGT